MGRGENSRHPWNVRQCAPVRPGSLQHQQWGCTDDRTVILCPTRLAGDMMPEVPDASERRIPQLRLAMRRVQYPSGEWPPSFLVVQEAQLCLRAAGQAAALGRHANLVYTATTPADLGATGPRARTCHGQFRALLAARATSALPDEVRVGSAIAPGPCRWHSFHGLPRCRWTGTPVPLFLSTPTPRGRGGCGSAPRGRAARWAGDGP